MESKSNQRMASSSAINDGGKIEDGGTEVANISESLDHWHFLEEIEAPMWADLSKCNFTNDETDDPWFNISHEFHQCPSHQLISTVFHPTKSTNTQEPSSPKLPASVSKSRGKNYKSKQWGQRNCKAIPNKKHPVKTLTKKPSINTGSTNKPNPISKSEKSKVNEGPKASSSCGSNRSNTSYTANQEHENSAGSSLTSDHSQNQENKCFDDVSFQTSGQTSKLMSSLRKSLRTSYVTRPAARGVVINSGRCSEGSSSNSSVGPSSSNNNLRTLKAPALYDGSSVNRQGNSMVSSKVTAKGKVQQNASVGRALMPHNINKQIIRTDKEKGTGRRTASLAVIKEKAPATIATCENGKSSRKTAEALGRVEKASKQNMTQNSGTKKLTGLKVRTTNRSKDKESAKPARKVYFR